MKRKITARQALVAYRLLRDAHYTKLPDEDKVRVWRITRALRPMAERLEEGVRDAQERLKPEGFDERLALAQRYEITGADIADITERPDITEDTEGRKADRLFSEEKYRAFLEELNGYRRLIDEATSELAKEEMDIDNIEESSYGLLLASNDWTAGQAVELGELIAGVTDLPSDKS